MNILIDGLPEAIEIDDIIYDINADYQTALRILQAYEDDDLTAQERCIVLLNLLYKEPPQNPLKAVKQGLRYLDCGDDTEEKQLQTTADGCRYYSFTHDARWIYAGVDRVLNGRLSRGSFVHWWEFVTAFMELPEDCMMSRILYLRQQRAKGKLSLEERRQWVDMRHILELPVQLSETEQAARDAFMELLGGY